MCRDYFHSTHAFQTCRRCLYMSLWGRWSTVSLFFVFLPVLTVKIFCFVLFFLKPNKQANNFVSLFFFFWRGTAKKSEHKQWLLDCRIHMHNDFVTSLWSISGGIYSREKRDSIVLYVEAGEVASLLKGRIRIQNNLEKLDRTDKICKQEREELKVSLAEKGQVVGWHSFSDPF